MILSLLMHVITFAQIPQNNKFAISLQYLKEEVRNGSHFLHADKRQSFHKLVLSFLMEVARHVQVNQNRKLVVFLQYIKTNCCNCFVFYCDSKHSYFMRVQSCLLLLFDQSFSFQCTLSLVPGNIRKGALGTNGLKELVFIITSRNISHWEHWEQMR